MEYPIYNERTIYQNTDTIWGYNFSDPVEWAKAWIKRKRSDETPVFELETKFKDNRCFVFLDAKATRDYKMTDDVEVFQYDILVKTISGTQFYVEQGNVRLVRSVTR